MDAQESCQGIFKIACSQHEVEIIKMLVIQYLGHAVSEACVCTDRDKIQAIKEYLRLETVADVWSFFWFYILL